MLKTQKYNKHNSIMNITYSIDPRTSAVNVYPFHISKQIMEAHESGKSSIAFPDFFNCVIHFNETEWIQTTSGAYFGSQQGSMFNKISGYRSVGVFPYIEEQKEYSTRIIRKYGSHYLVKDSDHGEIVQKSFEIPDDYFDEVESQIPVWHYCGKTTSDESIYLVDSWNPFQPDENDQIEAEFQKNNIGSLNVSIGCRTFKIEFNGIYGTQTDEYHGLKRAIQRKMIHESDYNPKQEDDEMDDDAVETCFCLEAITSFKSIKLPCCGKDVHKLCIKPLANQNMPCPFCRATTAKAVWETTLGESVGVCHGGGR